MLPLILPAVSAVLMQLRSTQAVRVLVVMAADPQRLWRPGELKEPAGVGRQHVYVALHALEAVGAVEVADDGWRLATALLGAQPEPLANQDTATPQHTEAPASSPGNRAPVHPDAQPGETVDQFLARRLREKTAARQSQPTEPVRRVKALPPLRTSFNGTVRL